MKIRAAAVLGALLVSACGGGEVVTVHTSVSPFAPASSSPSPIAASPTPRPTGLLFAVLETPHPGAFPANADTVAIVGLDGYARAKQHFTPRTVPGECNAAGLPQPEARVAAGRVYYADGTGQVRSLDPTGSVSNVIAFPQSSQQMLSFGVDPSGAQVLGSLITVPKFTPPLPCQQEGQYAVDLEYGPTGGHPQNVYHQTYQQADEQSNFIEVVGWDPAGALINVHSTIATQQGPFGRHWFGQLAHWTPQGVGSVVGGSDCRAQDQVGNSIACISSEGEGAGSVRGPDGSIQWNLPSAIYYFIVLSPDATKAAYCNSSGCGVAAKNGSPIKLPTGFQPSGWLDASTVIGVTGDIYGEMETVSLSDPAKVNDLGFKGSFVGVVQAS